MKFRLNVYIKLISLKIFIFDQCMGRLLSNSERMTKCGHNWLITQYFLFNLDEFFINVQETSSYKKSTHQFGFELV